MLPPVEMISRKTLEVQGKPLIDQGLGLNIMLTISTAEMIITSWQNNILKERGEDYTSLNYTQVFINLISMATFWEIFFFIRRAFSSVVCADLITMQNGSRLLSVTKSNIKSEAETKSSNGISSGAGIR